MKYSPDKPRKLCPSSIGALSTPSDGAGDPVASLSIDVSVTSRDNARPQLIGQMQWKDKEQDEQFRFRLVSPIAARMFAPFYA